MRFYPSIAPPPLFFSIIDISNRDFLPAERLDFQISRKARDTYQFDLSMFSLSGAVIFANFHAARLFARKMNEKRDLVNYPEQAVSAAELSAMGLIHEILHSMLQQYRSEKNSSVFDEALDWLSSRFGEDGTESMLRAFLDEFPPLAVYRGEQSVEQYLQQQTGDRRNRQIALEEMLLLWLHNLNPAFNKYRELFDDTPLRERGPYKQAMEQLEVFFDSQPLAGPDGAGINLLHLLRSPILANPGSLSDQLRFMQERWGKLLKTDLSLKWSSYLSDLFVEKWGTPSTAFETRLLRNIDFITEETKVRFNPGLGPAPTEVLEFHGQEEEVEQFSADLHWMPRLVLMAKSTLVWLDQLSKKHEREITRLDQIPDEELDHLASWGFTGLWLIGIWERSKASRDIKHLCGNPEAASSAYSLFDYQIARQIGGEEAYASLRERCWQRGIRLGSDMVPNHTGIDSKWVHEHPEWFVQSPYPPFPAYTFNSINLSSNPQVGIYLEDHYYDRTDAAVVFKQVNFTSGETRYIYHGNDGTSMPWNDTAQLNYLNPEVREEVIQTILKVARKFPVIRFDAAMTLAKRHFHRLWFPEPGSGGDIPSRAEHGLTRAQLDALMPQEFWREVVDRVAREAPDTLLLAEAFWMMEGYFVRTLGMHRVYNSAFMHMLMKEENKKYRYTIKNTLEFDPEVLKRYVNFMSNPDEETASEQFGDGDKYFGICVLMCTMPGLPMFGHGQVEGFREKYGMEYQRAYLDEQPNRYLIERHEREIFPLLTFRYLFAEVEHFLLYDFYMLDGSVNENVFAYSNRFERERTLVVFNNAYTDTSGWILSSAAFLEKSGEQRRLKQRTLGEGLELRGSGDNYTILRDHISGLETLHKSQTLLKNGLYMELKGYQYRVFTSIREIRDDETRHCARLMSYLDGRGVPSIEEALRELNLQPVHQSYRVFAAAGVLKRLWELRDGEDNTARRNLAADILEQYEDFAGIVSRHYGLKQDSARLLVAVQSALEAALNLSAGSLQNAHPLPRSRRYKQALKLLDDTLAADTSSAVLFNWVFVHALGMLQEAGEDGEAGISSRSCSCIDDWLLYKVIRGELQLMSRSEARANEDLVLLRLLTTCQHWFSESTGSHDLLEKLFGEREFRQYLSVNRYNDILWFNKEAFEKVSSWLYVIAAIKLLTGNKPVKPGKNSTLPDQLLKRFEIAGSWLKALEKSEYQVSKLLEALKPKAKATKSTASKTKASKTKASKTKTEKTGTAITAPRPGAQPQPEAATRTDKAENAGKSKTGANKSAAKRPEGKTKAAKSKKQ